MGIRFSGVGQHWIDDNAGVSQKVFNSGFLQIFNARDKKK